MLDPADPPSPLTERLEVVLQEAFRGGYVPELPIDLIVERLIDSGVTLDAARAPDAGLRTALEEMVAAYSAKPDTDEIDHPEGLTKEQVELAWSLWDLRQVKALGAARAALASSPAPAGLDDLRAALKGLDAPFAWLTEHYPKAMAEMPTDLFRAFDKARAALASSPAPAGLTLLEDVAVQPDDGPRDGLNKGTRVYLAPAPAGLDVERLVDELHTMGLGCQSHWGTDETARRAYERHGHMKQAERLIRAATRPAEDAGADMMNLDPTGLVLGPNTRDGTAKWPSPEAEERCPHHPNGCSVLEDGEPSIE
jgi:hypothetical protein